MSLLKQIDDKGAVLEWSPVASQPHLVALGTKVRSYFNFAIGKWNITACIVTRILLDLDSMITAESLNCTI
jgi:hypothetical protein